MRIISKFKDYYDCGMSYGFDKDFLFIRNSNVTTCSKNVFVNELLMPDYWNSWTTQGIGIIGFCGKYFPYVSYFEGGVGRRLFGYEGVHIANNVDKKYLHFYSKFLAKDLPLFSCIHTLLNEYFSRHVPVFYVQPDGWGLTVIHTNPILNTFNFQKVCEPIQAYQKIRMFLGNFADPEKAIPSISNADMIEAKGFDRKTSFRKGKSS